MISAWYAKTKDTKVTVLEAGEKAGRKLLATGNGKCNLTYGSKIPPIAYRGGNPAFAGTALERFTRQDTINFFESLGMLTREKNGGIYPYTEQAKTVCSILLNAISKKGIHLKTRERVMRIVKKQEGFLVETETWHYHADAVILACGSSAAPALGGSGSGYMLAEQCGHSVRPVLPALVPLKTSEKRLYTLAGLRSHASISLLADGIKCFEASGELQWTSYGISGIAVFQVSRFAAAALQEGRKVTAVLNLLPDQSLEELLGLLSRLQDMPAARLFSGIFPEKLAAVLLRWYGVNPSGYLPQEQIRKILELAMHLPVPVTGTLDFEYAQVCAGGVDTGSICPETMESVLVPGLYFAGEMMDIDGACGGYNLQWAWSSGYLAGVSSSGNSCRRNGHA